MLRTKKGAALLQVLLVTVVLAGMATMLLRASLSRTTTARHTRRSVAGQMLINSCQAEVSAMWGVKSQERFVKDLASCWMYCKCTPQAEDAYTICQANGTDSSACIAAKYGESVAQTCENYGTDSEQCTTAQGSVTAITPCQCTGTNVSREYPCTKVSIGNVEYKVKAKFTGTAPADNGQCALEYTLEDNSGNAEVVL